MIKRRSLTIYTFEQFSKCDGIGLFTIYIRLAAISTCCCVSVNKQSANIDDQKLKFQLMIYVINDSILCHILHTTNKNGDCCIRHSAICQSCCSASCLDAFVALLSSGPPHP